VLFREGYYQSSAYSTTSRLIDEHVGRIAQQLGVPIHTRADFPSGTQLRVRRLRAPAVYSDAGHGLRTESLVI